MANKTNTESDFWSKLKVSDTGCWLWVGKRNRGGYGVLSFSGESWRAHRLAYFFIYPDADKGLQVLHRCDIPNCCRPNHLFSGRHSDNMRDMAAKGRHHEQGKAHCPAGHEYNSINTRMVKNGHHGGLSRQCIACQRNRKRQNLRNDEVSR